MFVAHTSVLYNTDTRRDGVSTSTYHQVRCCRISIWHDQPTFPIGLASRGPSITQHIALWRCLLPSHVFQHVPMPYELYYLHAVRMCVCARVSSTPYVCSFPQHSPLPSFSLRARCEAKNAQRSSLIRHTVGKCGLLYSHLHLSCIRENVTLAINACPSGIYLLTIG